MYTYDAIHNSVIHVEDEDDRVLQDGEHLRVRMTAMDSTQRAIAGNVATLDDDVKLINRQEMADWDKAQLSARWKGGLQDGDTFRLGDKFVVVSGRNPTNGKIVLREARTSTADAETRQSVYDSYDQEIQTRYLGDSPDQVEPAGPLSDEERVQAKDQAYADYDAELAQRWRR